MNTESRRRSNQRKREFERRRNQRWVDRTRNNHGHTEPGIGWVYVLMALMFVALFANAWGMSR